MPLTETEMIYLGHQNTIDLILNVDGTAASLSTSTCMKLVLGKDVISSTNGSSTEPIKWAQAGYATGEVRICIGGSTLVKPGKYNAVLIVYGATYSSGVVWDDNIPIRILKDPITT